MNTFTKFITITSTALLMAAPLYASETTEKLPETRKTSTQVSPIHLADVVVNDDVFYVIGKKLACLEALDNDNKIDSSPGNLAKLGYKLALLTKNWIINIAMTGMQVNTPLWKTLHGIKTQEDEAIFKIFSNGKLVYKPNENNNEGKIELLFSEFANPFNGVFDLSNCGDVSQYLRITTNPSIFFALEEDRNATLNILIAPHYLINKFLSTSAQPFAGIMPDWEKATAPVGIFWRMSTWADKNNYDYLTTKSIEWLSGHDLEQAWADTMCEYGTDQGPGRTASQEYARHIRKEIHWIHVDRLEAIMFVL